MELRFALIYDTFRLEIDEPVGFDAFEPEIERNEMHGVSVEYSDIDLEFTDCDAIDIIKRKYESNLDSVIEFVVEMNCNDDFDEIYRGRLDLSTYQHLKKEYSAVKCKVGQTGVFTTFNNRISTDVCVDDTVSVDGVELPDYDLINKEISIPGHNLIVKSRSWDDNVGEFIPLAYSLEAGPRNIVYAPVMMNSETGDNGVFPFQSPYVVKSSEAKDLLLPYFEFDKGIHIEKTQIDYSFDFIIRLENSEENITLEEIYPNATFIIETGKEGGVLENREITAQFASQPLGVKYYEKRFSFGGTLQDVNFDQLYVYLIITVFVPSNLTPIALQRYSLHTKPRSSYFNVTSNSILPPTTSKINMLHETMARITESITNNEMTVWSDYYGRPDSFAGATKPYPPAKSFGPGSLRCLTNGYKLRQYKYANGESAKMYLSMKKLVNSLSAIDNIGCGFSFGQGRWWVRVENWKWFYKNIELFEINNPSNVERSHDLDETFTRLKIGYKKYADISEANVVDTFHSERNYTTLAKAVDKELQAMSELVADPFAIEYTRRKSIDKDTKDWRYDEDIFIICVMRVNVKKESGGVVSSDVTAYEVDNGMEETGNTVTSPETVINVYISPARNAMRWADRFSQYPGANGLSYTSGTRNTNAKGTRKSIASPQVVQSGGLTTTTTYERAWTIFVEENKGINKSDPYLKSQIISFDYPITMSQWNIIRMNPYGYIRVDGERCWLKKVQYNFKTGLTKFELIPEWS
ncbi:hypothetical protein [Proteiniphilum sp. X52]|uniref:hypothetical protein n=1 Tax=Proteiniphilum sp. X52 TaxID=2382159 RepID=UPI000F0A3F3F|nr:hypothetical protein [Proteiniphilum sp. X52]RNC66466.1 hypothetical protein D7D25_03020 [Proteiniphilum sp. X52]